MGMQVSFVRGTHYVFTSGKDGALKYWDADRWELLLSLGGHRGETWALAVSSLGDFVITGGLSCYRHILSSSRVMGDCDVWTSSLDLAADRQHEVSDVL